MEIRIHFQPFETENYYPIECVFATKGSRPDISNPLNWTHGYLKEDGGFYDYEEGTEYPSSEVLCYIILPESTSEKIDTKGKDGFKN